VPYDRELAEIMRAALVERPQVSERAMFGGICWMLNGNMLCGVEVGRFMFRVGKAGGAQALAWPGAEAVEFNGRRMGGMVWVAADECPAETLPGWIELAERFVGTLPPK
jgi:hypothetical protein